MKTKKNLKPPKIKNKIKQTEHQLLTLDLEKEESEKANGGRAAAAMGIQREKERTTGMGGKRERMMGRRG